jgi:hypothetical protein
MGAYRDDHVEVDDRQIYSEVEEQVHDGRAPAKLSLANTGVSIVKRDEVGWKRWPDVLHPVREHRAAR